LLSVICELFSSIATQKRRSGSITPEDFVVRLQKENAVYRSAQHQDAHEFFNYLINTLADLLVAELEVPSTSSSAPQKDENPKTWVHEIFEGIFENQTKCLCCESVTSQNESFLDLSIDVEPNTSLSGCLHNFFSTETLSGPDKFFCDHCCSLQDAQKCLKVKRLPHILVVHLKRFKYSEAQGAYCKLNYRVPFPFELRLSNAAAGLERPDRLYTLFAFVVHIGGGIVSGHYVSLVKSHHQWFQFDDDTVSVHKEQHLASWFGSTHESIISNTGYMLFYEQVSE